MQRERQGDSQQRARMPTIHQSSLLYPGKPSLVDHRPLELQRLLEDQFVWFILSGVAKRKAQRGDVLAYGYLVPESEPSLVVISSTVLMVPPWAHGLTL